MLTSLSGIYCRSLVLLLVFYCDGILFGSVLNLIKVKGDISYEFFVHCNPLFSGELCIRCSDFTTCE